MRVPSGRAVRLCVEKTLIVLPPKRFCSETCKFRINRHPERGRSHRCKPSSYLNRLFKIRS